MKKIHLIVQKKDRIPVLNKLRDLGTVHVENEQPPAGARIHRLKDRMRTISRAVEILSEYDKQCRCEQRHIDHCLEIADRIVEQHLEIEEIEEDMDKRAVQISLWEPWGDFHPHDIQRLADQGKLYIYLCEVPVKEMDQTPLGVVLQEIFRASGVARCVAVSQQPVKLPFHVVPLPEGSLSEMKGLQTREQKRIKELQNKIKEEAVCHKCLGEYLAQLKEELEFEQVAHGVGEREELIFLKGYCPVDHVRSLSDHAKKERWGLMVEDPKEDEAVPTLLRNPRWVEAVRPVFQLMNIVPGYQEFDISLIFLPFFAVFTGMLIGDAAYGAILFLITSFVHFKFGKKIKDKAILALMYALSVATMAWGLLTGTVFGQAWLPDVIQPLVPWLRDNNNVMLVCFVIGALHLSIAHGLKAVVRFPAVSFLGELGLAVFLWAVFFLVRFLILDIPIPEFANGMFVAGASLILFFVKPSKNIFKAVASGVGVLFGSLIGSFADIISYIRLFAVGLSSLAIADAFNKMAADIGFTTTAAIILAALVLIFGHVLNIILCLMAVIVHGVRLNILEFSSHMNVEWKGIPFHPFRKLKATK